MHLASPSNPTNQHLQALYRDHHGWLFHWLRSRIGCPQNAADLAQDTFLSILSSKELLQIREPRSFLSTVARRLMANAYRRRQVEEAYLEALQVLPEAVEPSPEVRLLALEALTLLDRLLDQLPGKVREAFLLAHLQGLKIAEIAERLQVSTRSVKYYLVRANQHCFFAHPI
ncbi:RNA polymerase subunit sigma [Pseudomonas aeruginosa]|uniref:sigma-70 family RNA polymerase sigma factor n=1 Tax=Pseudomonas aeruginosa TaxID=287 RepID=UPI00053F1C8C|nr:sigma-70 family RNA polymerase sigma factor [Pseudomonas aeruginosa]MBI8144594.1 sigma-70 family RNA polymerase sigma factor [Pseudomonas aeruginosa]MBX5686376.1 sigma-70 family RNA polymerase sigma factor [Pseudomonas aeruginosa]MBX5789050.1 sigma-70 family RNA polymerase sigma factor [Pseudomonas aeruginosa]MCT5136900.1 sigma-70 family RNA polymerase sigma factor [Pseudomonas aeruginosa]MCV4096404.1 sigma-70 family RNA polymerase sigma factor [Pseudomonas aeruginosa]